MTTYRNKSPIYIYTILPFPPGSDNRSHAPTKLPVASRKWGFPGNREFRIVIRSGARVSAESKRLRYEQKILKDISILFPRLREPRPLIRVYIRLPLPSRLRQSLARTHEAARRIKKMGISRQSRISDCDPKRCEGQCVVYSKKFVK